ncbi:MAG: FadR family transcriptional regulator [Lachnospiraceae bacterium]|nr:FadR family transcriptional regulator [Lachnospiraceae bacterium]
MSDSIYRIKLRDDVANHIIECIRSQKWTAGMKLPAETELAKYFDVSRSTVRSAVKSLQNQGILHSRAGSGTYVVESAPLVLETRELAQIMADSDNLYELVQTRCILEPELSFLAAQNADEAEIPQLFDILTQMELKKERYHLMTCGYQFHQTIAALAHNKVLYGFYQSAASQLRSLRVLDSLTLDTFVEDIEDHRQIARAIAARNADLAKSTMQTHLEKDYARYLNKPSKTK